MVDQKKNTSPDDEYQFPQEEYIVSADSDASQQSIENEVPTDIKKSGVEKMLGALSNLSPILQRNKRIVIVIVAVLVGLLLLHFSASKKISVPVQPEQVTQSSQQQVVSTPVQQPNNDAMMGSLDSLQAHSSKTTSDIKSLQSQIADLQSAVSQSQSQNDQLQNAIGALADQVKGISVELDQFLARDARAKKSAQITYHLRAVVPDRAWITSAGQTQSVTIGDNVRSYGKVTAIYAQHGIVETSSGRKIEFGPNDR